MGPKAKLKRILIRLDSSSDDDEAPPALPSARATSADRAPTTDGPVAATPAPPPPVVPPPPLPPAPEPSPAVMAPAKLTRVTAAFESLIGRAPDRAPPAPRELGALGPRYGYPIRVQPPEWPDADEKSAYSSARGRPPSALGRHLSVQLEGGGAGGSGGAYLRPRSPPRLMCPSPAEVDAVLAAELGETVGVPAPPRIRPPAVSLPPQATTAFASPPPSPPRLETPSVQQLDTMFSRLMQPGSDDPPARAIARLASAESAVLSTVTPVPTSAGTSSARAYAEAAASAVGGVGLASRVPLAAGLAGRAAAVANRLAGRSVGDDGPRSSPGEASSPCVDDGSGRRGSEGLLSVVLRRGSDVDTGAVATSDTASDGGLGEDGEDGPSHDTGAGEEGEGASSSANSTAGPDRGPPSVEHAASGDGPPDLESLLGVTGASAAASDPLNDKEPEGGILLLLPTTPPRRMGAGGGIDAAHDVASAEGVDGPGGGETWPTAPWRRRATQWAADGGGSSAASSSLVDWDDDPTSSRLESLSSAAGDHVMAGREPGMPDSRPGAGIIPAKRHPDEDDSSPAWRSRRKHMFMLSAAGKPIYCRHGDESKLAGFTALMGALAATTSASADGLRWVRCGRHMIVFVARGQVLCVAVSRSGEPPDALAAQLELLHGHLLAVLTTAAERALIKSPAFDLRTLLGGCAGAAAALVRACDRDAAVLLCAAQPLPLPPLARRAAMDALRTACGPPPNGAGAAFAVLLADDCVVATVAPRGAPLHPDDLLLLATFVHGSAAFHSPAGGASFAPVCLPRHDPHSFLHAYVSYLMPRCCLVLLAGGAGASAAAAGAYERLAAARALTVEPKLRASRVLDSVMASLAIGGAGVRLDALPRGVLGGGGGRPGAPLLWHFLFKRVPRRQYVSAQWAPPADAPTIRRDITAAYAQAHASMHAGASQALTQRVHYVSGDGAAILAVATADFELYAAFDPLADKAASVGVCNRLSVWLRSEDSAPWTGEYAGAWVTGLADWARAGAAYALR